MIDLNNASGKDKPVSARSNNLEIWLSKKKALDQYSNKQSTIKKDGDDIGKSIDENEKDLSYLSKLQSSLFFEPGPQFKDLDKLIDSEKMKVVQKSDQ